MGDVGVGVDEHADPTGGPGEFEVRGDESAVDDQMRDVGNRRAHMVVEAVALEKPAVAPAAELVEGFTLDEREQTYEVLEPVGPTRGRASSETAEQVGVDQHGWVEPVGGHAASLRGLGLRSVR